MADKIKYPVRAAPEFKTVIEDATGWAIGTTSKQRDEIIHALNGYDELRAGLDRLYNAVKTDEMADNFDPALGDEVLAALDAADALLNPKEETDGQD